MSDFKNALAWLSILLLAALHVMKQKPKMGEGER